MEELKKLEEVQRIIELMQSHGVIDSSNQNPQSQRFLANFTLFLIQQSNGLDAYAKCQLISEHVTKISASFLDEALQSIGEVGTENIRIDIPPDNKADCDPSTNDFQEAAMVGLDAMQRANSTLEDFFRSYFMFHHMDVHQPRSIFRYLPILSFTESYIYQRLDPLFVHFHIKLQHNIELDSLNEKLLQLPTYGLPVWDRESVGVSKAERKWEATPLKMLNKDPFRPLVLLLEHHGLLTERIKEELSSGVEYWALERKLCSLSSKDEITVGDVMMAVHLKSFDYRVLNLLLYELRGEKVSELHMEFLAVSEFLVEVADDLFDYEDDVLENNFNILRMFVRIYGVSAAPYKLAKCIAEAEKKYETLLKSLDPELSMNYQRRCEEATKEGGKTSGPPLGTWNIPAIIEDEDSYRRENLTANP